MLSYPSSMSLSTRTLNHVAGLIRAYRAACGSRWRRLGPGRQALLVLAHLRNGGTYARLAAGFGVGIATAYRYVTETVDLLAATAPDLAAAMRRIRRLALVILDGTLIAIDRLRGEKGPVALLRKAQTARGERAGAGRRGRQVGVGQPRAARCDA